MKYARTQAAFFERLRPHRQLAELFDLLPGLSFFIKDRRGRFMALNRRGCEYCGVASEQDAIGRTDHDFFPSQRADEYRADDLSVLESGEPILNRIESAPEAAGSPRLVMTSKIPLRDARGRVIGIAGFSRQVEDIRDPSGTVDAFADVVDYLHRNYGEPLTTAALAERADLSVPQFERRFRRAFDTSPHQYLLRVRIENAARLLAESDQTVSDIAQTCGFYDHAHLSRSFRKAMKTTPSAHRQKFRPHPKAN